MSIVCDLSSLLLCVCFDFVLLPMQLRAVIMEGNPFHSSCNVFILMGCIFVADPPAAEQQPSSAPEVTASKIHEFIVAVELAGFELWI